MDKIAKDVRREIDEDVVMSTITDAISASEISVKVDTAEIKVYTDEVEAKVDATKSAIQTDIVGQTTTLQGDITTTETEIKSDAATNLSTVEADISNTELSLRNRKYEKVLYVAQSGDDTNGLSWETAYNDFDSAYADASATGVSLIMVGAGVWDRPSSAKLNIEKQLHIKGMGAEHTTFTNTYGTSPSHYIWWVMDQCTIEDCTFRCYASANKFSAIRVYGSPTRGTIIKNCNFYFAEQSLTDIYLIELDTTARVHVSNINIWGTKTRTIAIIMKNVSRSSFKNIEMTDVKYGFFTWQASVHRNRYKDIRIQTCNTGMDFSSGGYSNLVNDITILDATKGLKFNGEKDLITDSKFINCTTGVEIGSNSLKTSLSDSTFTHCITNINDVGTSTELTNIKSTIKNHIYPESLTGITLPNSGVLDVWGATTTIIPTDTIQKPFKILAYTSAPSDDKKFIIRLSADGGTNWFLHMFDRRDGVNGEMGRMIVIHDTIFPKGAEISGSILAEVTDETVDIWLYYQEI